MSELTRRGFVKASMSAAGGLMLGFSLPVSALRNPWEPASSTTAEISAWLLIEPDDAVVIRIARSEMGQGVMTSLAMLVAEELEADWRNVRVEYADVNRQMREGHPYGKMATDSSSAVRDSRELLQLAGAEARERLIKAAAETWVVDPQDCYADYGQVYRRGSSQSLRYGEVAALAAQVSVANVKIRKPDDFKLLGLPTSRLDTAVKVDGSAVYGMDVRVPGMVYATIVHCPVAGGRLRGSRFNAIRHMPGIMKEVRLEGAVAVVAETFWQAKQAADALPVFWDYRDGEKTFSDTYKRAFFAEFEDQGEVLTEMGDIVSLMDSAERTIESDYHVPYLAHAPMEPLNCTVHVREGRVDVWAGHQDPEGVVRAVAEVTGRPAESVYFHNCFIGGSFGRRRHLDFVEHATRIAMVIGRPVQLIYTREEDIRAGGYRPMSAMRFKAGFDINKRLLAITNHSVTHSIQKDHDPSHEGVDSYSIEGLVDHPYRFPAYRFSHTQKKTHLSTWWWRSAGASINVYGRECFIDEMALAAGQDPIRYRRQLLRAQPRYLEVLETLEQASDWGKNQFPPETAMGMAIHEMHGTVVGLAAQTTVTASGTVDVDRIVAVVDCGNLVNPMIAEQQVEGGILFGLTAALYGKLTIENGQVLEDNLDTYEIVRMNETPKIEIHWANAGKEDWGGLGEPGVPVVAPAICNALYSITGRRIRSLPIRDYYLRVSRR
jgi:isoquinoline 1-oxidoreductase beta subunit